jgi:hypothetical protein
MTSTGAPSLADFEHSQLAKTGLRVFVIVASLVAVYYFFPLPHRHDASVAVRVVSALVFFGVVVATEVRFIAKNRYPMLRAAVAMATIIPLFLVLFAWIYLTMSVSQPAAFGQVLDRTSALYFTVTVFSTVGFGDITAKTDLARLVVTIQMLTDLAVIAIVIRLILAAATRGQARTGADSSP